MLDQSIFLKALKKEINAVPPIWYMRQAEDIFLNTEL